MVGTHGILPQYVQEFQNLGVALPWMYRWPLIEPVIWIIVLFLAVTLLPNSLELLRRFQPALDFPEQMAQAMGPQTSLEVQQSAGAKSLSAAAKVRIAWAAVAQLRHEGVSPSRLTAMITALLWVLGVMALSRGGAFLYGQF
jgi:hypothetical protein